MSSVSSLSAITFLIQCPDQRGLVSRISSFFYQRGFNILHCQQFTDSRAGQFFMRIKLDRRDLDTSRSALQQAFADFATPLAIEWSVHYSDVRQRLAILVSRESHCLYDLLLRQQEGELACEVPLVISNHPHLEAVAEQFRVPFHCLPVNADSKPRQEQEMQRLLEQHHIELVVLARYMQILSPPLVAAWEGRIINIHHAFLPAFQGAKPYLRAYERGVKMIGATAHYVTAELDEGPILEQDVARVTHEDRPRSLARLGRDIERLVLSRAVKAHLEHRVILAGRRTIVFTGDG